MIKIIELFIFLFIKVKRGQLKNPCREKTLFCLYTEHGFLVGLVGPRKFFTSSRKTGLRSKLRGKLEPTTSTSRTWRASQPRPHRYASKLACEALRAGAPYPDLRQFLYILVYIF